MGRSSWPWHTVFMLQWHVTVLCATPVPSAYSYHRNAARRLPSTGVCPRDRPWSACVWPPRLRTGCWYRYSELYSEGLSLTHVFWSPETGAAETRMSHCQNVYNQEWRDLLYVQQQVIVMPIVIEVPNENMPSLITPLISPFPFHFPSAIIQQ